MTVAAVLCLASLAVLAAAAPATQTIQYNSRLDSVDIDKILGNPRVLQNYTKCFTDKGPCTAEGKEIKKILPEVIATKCSKCSPQLKANLKKTVITMRDKHPKEWEQVVIKMDPERRHVADLEKFLKS